LHVEDHCKVLLTILNRGKIGSTYTIGNNNERTNLDIIKIIYDTVDDFLHQPKGSS